MSIPLLEYAPSSQNQRVQGFDVSGDDQPRLYTTDNVAAGSEFDDLIKAAYRQIFHEQQMLSSNRQLALESQLKTRQITVREFVQGLATSDAFCRLNYEVNNNYRFVELCIQRILGRRVYSDREKIAWSIVLATKGVYGFIHDLVNSEEYTAAFGNNTVPYQRRRVLPQHASGELPFERMARYGQDYRDRLPQPRVVTHNAPTGPANGLFAQFEPFDLQTFVHRANWPIVAGLLMILAAFIVVSLATSIAANYAVG